MTALGCAAALLSFTVACGKDSVAEPDQVRIVAKLPEDVDEIRSKKNADAFRSWADRNGTASQKAAANRVGRILGEWDANTGNAYISTDIDGQKTLEADLRAMANDLVEAFDDWSDSELGYVSVYDRNGDALKTNHRF
ncbi:hypothetical protein [Streptomyces sp. NPDC002490]|uniref:hypothetical protein n=1 Tax=Streptomyces sp. NPDC002490 TaxID=3154416 RepID=UPI00331EB783